MTDVLERKAPPTPVIEITAPEFPPVVRVRRGDGVTDGFWLSAMVHWGATGPSPASYLEVPRDRFLSRVRWLPTACREHGVGIAWDPTARRFVQRLIRERELLDGALQGGAEATGRIRSLCDVGFQGELHEFQTRDLEAVLASSHGANFSVPGAGKTLVTLSAFALERFAGRVTRMVVVAPISAFEAWETESARWFDPPLRVRRYDGTIPPDVEILLVNYQRLETAHVGLAAFITSAPTQLVLDEAHRMKRGWTGQWGSNCLSLAYLAERRDVLTGTPAPNHPRDLRALVDFLWPGQASRLLPRAAMAPLPVPAAMHEMSRAIRPLFVRTTKAELELPPPTISLRRVPLQGLQKEIYETLTAQRLSPLIESIQERADFRRMGQVVMYLLEAATNPALLAVGSIPGDPPGFEHPPIAIPVDSRLGELIADYGRYETPAKFVELARIVSENASRGRKTLVWSNFVRNLELLTHQVLARLQPALVHGGIPAIHTGVDRERSREAQLERFREDPECFVLVANPAALAEGVSLHDICHDAVYLDRTFNAGQYLQSLDRIHRLGLSSDTETRATVLVTEDTIDTVVNDRVRQKSERLAAMLDDPELVAMSLPDEEVYGPVLDSAEDLAALFAHLRGER